MTRYLETSIPAERQVDDTRGPLPDTPDFDCMYRAAESYSATPRWEGCGD